MVRDTKNVCVHSFYSYITAVQYSFVHSLCMWLIRGTNVLIFQTPLDMAHLDN